MKNNFSWQRKSLLEKKVKISLCSRIKIIYIYIYISDERDNLGGGGQMSPRFFSKKFWQVNGK